MSLDLDAAPGATHNNGCLMSDAEALCRIVLARRSVRRFSPDPIPHGMLEQVLAITQRAPTGYNLQGWIAIVVTDADIKRKLRYAAFNQRQVEEAPAVVVFATDKNIAGNFERTASHALQLGHWSEGYANYLRKIVKNVFGRGFFGINNVVRWFGTRSLSFFRPMPMVPLGDAGFAGYGWKQVSLAAQTFMLAASAHGLDTCPMEGLDERWVKKALGLPQRYSVPLIIPVGRTPEPVKLSPRFPPDTVFHQDRYGVSFRGITPLSASRSVVDG
ncbi:MAG: hypothetical protein RIQ81_2562 [Pseudomonadota bacterium]|jgi:nitroreductase